MDVAVHLIKHIVIGPFVIIVVTVNAAKQGLIYSSAVVLRSSVLSFWWTGILNGHTNTFLDQFLNNVSITDITRELSVKKCYLCCKLQKTVILQVGNVLSRDRNRFIYIKKRRAQSKHTGQEMRVTLQ